jgi:hypothetical protein
MLVYVSLIKYNQIPTKSPCIFKFLDTGRNLCILKMVICLELQCIVISLSRILDFEVTY